MCSYLPSPKICSPPRWSLIKSSVAVPAPLVRTVYSLKASVPNVFTSLQWISFGLRETKTWALAVKFKDENGFLSEQFQLTGVQKTKAFIGKKSVY